MNKTPELVNLGLPSGNLWMKCNLGAKSEEDYGNYYQFGSLVGYQGIEAKVHSFWETSPFNNKKDEFDEEYFKTNRHKLIYKNGILRPEYDIITQTYGKDFKIPDSKDFQELLSNTIMSEVNAEKGGKLFTSKINNNTLFIPSSGYVWEGSFHSVGSHCLLWSCELDFSNPDCAYHIYFDSDDKVLCIAVRYFGFVLRGIKVKRD